MEPDYPTNSVKVEQHPKFYLKIISFEDCTKLGGLEAHVDEINKIKNLTFIACGTSFYACQTAVRLYKSLEIFNTIHAIEASEFNDYDLPRHDAGGIFVSQSGETADIYKAVN
jgi:glucosamine--fructose-6-phosphate aminotransferase (isomerizing)